MLIFGSPQTTPFCGNGPNGWGHIHLLISVMRFRFIYSAEIVRLYFLFFLDAGNQTSRLPFCSFVLDAGNLTSVCLFDLFPLFFLNIHELRLLHLHVYLVIWIAVIYNQSATSAIYPLSFFWCGQHLFSKSSLKLLYLLCICHHHTKNDPHGSQIADRARVWCEENVAAPSAEQHRQTILPVCEAWFFSPS